MAGPWCQAVPHLPHDRSGDRLPAGAGQGRGRSPSSRAWCPLSPSLPHMPSSPPALLCSCSLLTPPWERLSQARTSLPLLAWPKVPAGSLTACSHRPGLRSCGRDPLCSAHCGQPKVSQLTSDFQTVCPSLPWSAHITLLKAFEGTTWHPESNSTSHPRPTGPT